MKPEVKIWWQELADQYEEWAENPPMHFLGYEMYTCDALYKSDWGWGDMRLPSPDYNLADIWGEQYKRTPLPIGFARCQDRPSLRFEFCHHMAETIREAIGED